MKIYVVVLNILLSINTKLDDKIVNVIELIIINFQF
ncbi:hypothetical protein IMAU20067_01065 [Lactobacillus helveticus]|nr:hypothetical protein [Lactobacillus helveticus]NRO83125.1 hypothetical protein [Lactobacillus helveticus]